MSDETSVTEFNAMVAKLTYPDIVEMNRSTEKEIRARITKTKTAQGTFGYHNWVVYLSAETELDSASVNFDFVLEVQLPEDFIAETLADTHEKGYEGDPADDLFRNLMIERVRADLAFFTEWELREFAATAV